MSVVVLGDCIATGYNVLLHEILDDDNLLHPEYGLNEEQEKKFGIWFLSQNIKIKAENIKQQAYAYKLEQEMNLAWPSLIPGCTNLASQNETFLGMFYKIKEYLKRQKKPKLVLLTDFSPTHRCVVINNDGKHIVQNDIALIHDQQHTWKPGVYDQFKKKIIKQESFGEKYQKRKTKLSFDILRKFLKINQIPYKFLMFKQHNTYLTKNYIDCTDLIKTYTVGKQHHCKNKLKAQILIAKHVEKHI